MWPMGRMNKFSECTALISKPIKGIFQLFDHWYIAPKPRLTINWTFVYDFPPLFPIKGTYIGYGGGSVFCQQTFLMRGQ